MIPKSGMLLPNGALAALAQPPILDILPAAINTSSIMVRNAASIMVSEARNVTTS
jgi:hypothetical protein